MVETVRQRIPARSPQAKQVPSAVAVQQRAEATRRLYRAELRVSSPSDGAEHEADLMARRVIEWAGRELGGLANGVIRQLGFESLDFDVVLVGSLYEGGPLLTDAMRQTVHAVAPGARFVRLTAPPVVGGVLLGMEQVGLNGRAVRERLIETTQVLLNSSVAATLDSVG